jgi:hypothetical protein
VSEVPRVGVFINVETDNSTVVTVVAEAFRQLGSTLLTVADIGDTTVTMTIGDEKVELQ